MFYYIEENHPLHGQITGPYYTKAQAMEAKRKLEKYMENEYMTYTVVKKDELV